MKRYQLKTMNGGGVFTSSDESYSTKHEWLRKSVTSAITNNKQGEFTGQADQKKDLILVSPETKK